MVERAAKTDIFNPCTALVKTEDYEPGKHLVLAVLGVFIYELNKCAATQNSGAIASCNKQLQICQGYVKSKEDFSTSLQSFPNKFTLCEQVKVQKISDGKKNSASDYDQIDKAVKAMDNMDKLAAVIVALVTMAKDDGEKHSNGSTLLGCTRSLQLGKFEPM